MLVFETFIRVWLFSMFFYLFLGALQWYVDDRFGFWLSWTSFIFLLLVIVLP